MNYQEPKILFYLETRTEFKSLFPIAKALSLHNFDVVIGFTSLNDFSDELKITAKENIPSVQIKVLESQLDYIFPGSNSYRKVQGPFVKKTISSWMNKFIALKFRIKKILFKNSYFLPQTFLNVRLNQKNKFAFFRFLADHMISHVIMAEDAFTFGRGSAIAAAKKYGAMTVVFPYTISYEKAPYLFICEHKELLEKLQVKGIHKRMFAFLFPNWTCRLDKINVFRWYVEEMTAARLCKTLSPYPWKYNNGTCDYLLVESEFMKEYYLRNGIPKEKIINTGTTYYDFPSNLSLNKRTGKTIVLSLIPDFKPNPYFQDLKAVWIFFVTSIRKYLPDFTLLVSVHPRTPYEDVAFLESYGCTITGDIPVQQLMRDCDLFITSVSAAIRFALFFNLPIINFDMYGYHYDHYDPICTVRTIYSKEDYENILKRIAFEPAYLDHWKREYLSYKDYFGRDDGKNTGRIVDFFSRLKNVS